MDSNRLREILKKKELDRTEQEIRKMIEMVSKLDYFKEIKDEEVLYSLCQNAVINLYKEDELVYNSDDINAKPKTYFLILTGSANLYTCDKIEKSKKKNWLKSLNSGDIFGTDLTSNLLESNSKFKKCIVYSNSVSEIAVFTIEEIRFKPKEIQTFATFDPDLFLIDNPTKLYDLIDSVKEKIENEFKIFRKYKNTVEKFSNDQIMTEALQLVPHKTNFKEISNLVEQKYNNFTEDSKLDMKIGIVMDKTLNNLKQCNNDIKNDLEEIKNKFYQDSNPKNQNLLKINVEEEVNKQEFKNFVIEKLNKDGKMDTLFQQKKKNEEIINNNKTKIKNDEAFLQETFYCVLCHSKPRCILTDCNHLVVCEDCIEKTKICRKCGNNINKYQKIFRS